MEEDIKKIKRYVFIMLIIFGVTALVLITVACITLPRMAAATAAMQQEMSEAMKNMEVLSEATSDKLQSFDVGALNQAIENFRDAIAPLADLMNKFK